MTKSNSHLLSFFPPRIGKNQFLFQAYSFLILRMRKRTLCTLFTMTSVIQHNSSENQPSCSVYRMAQALQQKITRNINLSTLVTLKSLFLGLFLQFLLRHHDFQYCEYYNITVTMSVSVHAFPLPPLLVNSVLKSQGQLPFVVHLICEIADFSFICCCLFSKLLGSICKFSLKKL